MSIAPKFCIEFRFLTIVFFLLIETAPFARHVVTIIGSISGVSPTATEIPNRNACNQFPFVMPFITKTSGTIISIKRINTHDTAFTPFVKLVSTASSATDEAIEPKSVLSPTATITPAALPETTLLPINAILLYSVILPFSTETSGVFSTGSLSPVKPDWLIKRSFDLMIRISAGIISPTERCTISPATTSSNGISCIFPLFLSIVQVVVIIASSFSAALPLRDS